MFFKKIIFPLYSDPCDISLQLNISWHEVDKTSFSVRTGSVSEGLNRTEKLTRKYTKTVFNAQDDQEICVRL